MIMGRDSLLEQVSQCQTKTPPGFFLPCNLMGISFPHTLDHNQRYAYWFPFPWSQRDDSSSLAFTASCNFFLSYVEPMCRKEYPMTRPQKESDMKREHRVTIRLTDTEFSIIENTAEQADMTISEYMRKQIMEGQVNTKFEIVADVKEIKKLIGELGKIGSNLNQIARYFNQGGIISSEMRTEIKKSLRDIYEMKYEVMRMAGDFRGSD